MAVLEKQQRIGLKNILFATDFDPQANRAFPFAVALADRYDAKMYVAHVVPQEAYIYAKADCAERILKEACDYADYELQQIIVPLQHQGRPCKALLGDGDPAEAILGFARTYEADLIVVGTSSRTGLNKLFVGSVAEEIIREAPCPVLTVGPCVWTRASEKIECIVCAVDFSPSSLQAAKLAVSFAQEYQAHLTLMHVMEEVPKNLPDGADCAIQFTEGSLRRLLSDGPDLRYEPVVAVEVGPVAERVMNVVNELSADLIVIGVKGVGAFASTSSRFGSIAHKIVSLAPCPVLTVGGLQESEKK
jgi:nucleotide-binding universal stress UspA family protein